MGITKLCTHLHPAPSTSTQLISASTQLQQHSQQKFRPKNSKLSILTENWLAWYLGGADSEYRLRFLKFQPQSPFLGQFGPKKSKLSVLTENWRTWCLKDTDPYFNISFLNFQPKIHFWANLGQKSQSCPFCLKIGAHGIFWMLILIIPTLVF